MPPFRWSDDHLSLPLLGLGVALAMAMSTVGGCFEPSDTFVNISNANVAASSSGAGGGGEGGGGPIGRREFFEQNVKPGMVEACGKGECHGSGEVNFITVGLEYETITTYRTNLIAPGTPLLTTQPSTSVLITYPDAEDHSGRKWTEGLGDLKAATLTWMEMEIPFIEADPILEVGPVEPDGLTVLPLDPLGPSLEGFSMTFYAIALGNPATVLELTNISVWAPNGRAVRITDPTFVVYPEDPNEDPILETSFHGDPYVLVPPDAVQLGSGQLLLTDWAPGWEVGVRFADVKALFADEEGNTFEPCTRVDLFVDGVEELPVQSASNAPNGLLYCSEQCHGGNAGTSPTDVMNLAPLLLDPRDDDLACAKARPFITPSNVEGSQMIQVTKPGGGGTHPFNFGGNNSAHAAFQAAMADWIESEGQ
jgi:hypothetical protein